jgi:multiple sugar transport system substrate-binding protein
MYARKDLFTDPEHQKNFKAQYGYDLQMPETWEQALDIARYFNGKDLNGDGEPDYGFITLFSGVELGMWFLSIAGAYVEQPGPTVDRYHNVVLFDPETMEPRVKSPGFKRALEMFKELYKCAPKASISWGLTEQWDLFMRGRVALTMNCGDLATLSQDPNRSIVRGKLLCAPVPGSYEVWDYETNQWKKLDRVNRIGNIHGASWHGVISKFSKNKDVVYHLFAYLATKEIKQPITLMGWTGIDPGMIYDFPPEASSGYGTGDLGEFVEKGGVDREDILQSLSAYWKNYYEMDAWIPYNRLPGASEMLNSFEIHIGEYLADLKTADETLEAIYNDLNRIVDSRGREEMKQWYHEAIGYGGPAPNPKAELEKLKQ